MAVFAPVQLTLAGVGAGGRSTMPLTAFAGAAAVKTTPATPRATAAALSLTAARLLVLLFEDFTLSHFLSAGALAE